MPLKFQRQGINYDDLSDEDKEQWESLDWGDEDGEIPNRVEAEAVNKWLFNRGHHGQSTFPYDGTWPEVMAATA